MKAEFTEAFFINGEEISGSHKRIDLPFRRVSARALIIRKNDGAILGTLHREGGRFALPGGSIEDGESSIDAIGRELKEENITLVGSDNEWPNRIAVDYFDGYKELSIWNVFLVDDANVERCDENIETKWIKQDEDVWYPLLHERIILVIKRLVPKTARIGIELR